LIEIMKHTRDNVAKPTKVEVFWIAGINGCFL